MQQQSNYQATTHQQQSLPTSLQSNQINNSTVDSSSMSVTTHSLNLSSPWYELIANERKIYEGRLCNQERKTWKVGDIIVFKHDVDTSRPPLYCSIIEIRYFPSFHDAFTPASSSSCLADAPPSATWLTAQSESTSATSISSQVANSQPVPLSLTLPDILTVQQAVSIYERFYSLQQQQLAGVMMIRIKLMDDYHQSPQNNGSLSP